MSALPFQKTEASAEDEKRNKALADIDDAIGRIPEDEDDKSKDEHPDY